MSCVPIEIVVSPPIEVMVGSASYLPPKGTVFYYDFAFGDASHLIYNLLENEVLLAVWLEIITPFNGNGTVTVGSQSNPILFMNSQQNHPQQIDVYQTNPLYRAIADTGIYIYLNPVGETVGNGKIYLLVG